MALFLFHNLGLKLCVGNNVNFAVQSQNFAEKYGSFISLACVQMTFNWGTSRKLDF